MMRCGMKMSTIHLPLAYNDFGDWDEDDDNGLNTEEFNRTTFVSVDSNSDEKIDEQEWKKGTDNMFGDYASEDIFGEWDKDEDGFLDNEEWNEGFANTEWFNTYDENDDQIVDNNEWNLGIFDDWDDDDDGSWNQDEYNNYDSWWNS